jgi:uncharacterized cupredoxin-like copper-binding protein
MRSTARRKASTYVAPFIVMLFVATAFILGGCRSTAEEQDAHLTPVATPPEELEGGAESLVRVTLAEYSVLPDQLTVASGEVTFQLFNQGSMAHEFLIIRTNVPAGDLPLFGDIGEVDLEHEDLTLVFRHEAFPAGESREVTQLLPPGNYALICNLTGHYDSGMFSDFVVAADAPEANDDIDDE